MIYSAVIAAISYLIGSISPSVIISKAIYGKDIRQFGSGNAGATNALRVFGKKAGAAVFLIDFSKGLICAAAARCLVCFFDAPYECMLFAGFFAQFGHSFPVFFRFKGGKGVATAAGAAFAIMPTVAAALIAVFALITLITKTVSIGSGICAAVYPLLAYFWSDSYAYANFVFAAACAVLITLRHAENFARLLDGKEKRISFRKD
ncbi:MAG: glycerol-3-phosphate 1-O-acyltransferase PlsY [Clostridia bacterium]|nr:glycerol-3-phosphate 1-O-acyltransferase PlsY [Clostridia bacterium]